MYVIMLINVQVRVIFECLTVIGSLIYIIMAYREIEFRRFRIFLQTLV